MFKNYKVMSLMKSTAFIEFQFCKLKEGTRLKKILSNKYIKHWDVDSIYIYIDDLEVFFEKYADILGKTTSFNSEGETFDIFYINYYSRDLTNEIIKKLENYDSNQCIILAEWLKQSLNYNGFYLLGI